MRAWMAGLVVCVAGPGWAQEQVWIQVELLPTLDRAELSAQGYSEQLPDVAGFYMGSGWYGVALGPYEPGQAEAVMANLMAEGVIPGDAVILDSAGFGQQFWPPAAAAAADPAAVAPAEPAAPTEPVAVAETYDEAVASEARLSQAEKEALQGALKFAGVYSGGIDGAFGRGTRAAMSEWQAQRGHEVTGVLTTAQRAELLGEANAVLDGLGVETVRDEAAGIVVDLPLAVLGEPVTEAPFVRYDGRDGVPPQVVLISMPGDSSRLAGLYEIMQTLEEIPEDGPRERTAEAFVIEGRDAVRHSTTYAWLVDGQIKGFTLVWPAGDDGRRLRLLDVMRSSFRRLPAVLDPGVSGGAEQGVDLVSGLRVRQPEATASGFFADARGAVVTTAASVASCGEITLDGSIPARVATVDERLGLAVLLPDAEVAPRAVAELRAGAPRIGAEVAVAGYPYGAALARPAITFGTVADVRGLSGEPDLRRLSIPAQAGDAGGPVMDESGAVIGMLLPAGTGTTVLPDDVAYAVDAGAIQAVLAQAGVVAATSTATGAVGAERLAREGGAMAVLVSCW